MNLAIRRLIQLGILALPLQAATALAVPSLAPVLEDRELRVGVLVKSYFSKPYLSTADNGTGNLGVTAEGRYVGSRSYLQYGGEASSLYGLKHMNSRYLDVDELYAGLENKEKADRPFVYVGRKRFEWSDLDSYWSMGLFDPRFRWDYLSEKEIGLFGLFAGYRTDYLEAFGFFSPIFVPEQGAPFDISNGACHSTSPWFTCPNSSVTVFGQPTPVTYNLDMPPIKDVIMHPGGGASVRVGKQKGPFGRASYARKPMNQLLLAFEGQLSLVNNSIPAVIHPRVIYHDLFAFDVGVQDTRHSAVLSVIKEQPIRDQTPPAWTTQENSDATVIGATARSHLFPALKETKVEFSYLHRSGGTAPDRGPFASGLNFFEPRYAFQNAFSLAIFTPFSDDWAKKLLFCMKFIDDTVNTGNLLTVDSFYFPWRSVMTNLGLDLLGSSATAPVDFLARYKDNSRIRGGISYVF